MIIIYLVLFILFMGFLSFLIQKLKKDKKYKRKFYDFEDNTSVVIAVLVLIVSFVCINIFCSDPVFKNLSEQIEYGKKTEQPWLVSNAYKTQLQKNPDNIDLQFNLIE